MDLVASNALGIGAASFCSVAEKDIAESPTASPERHKTIHNAQCIIHNLKLKVLGSKFNSQGSIALALSNYPFSEPTFIKSERRKTFLALISFFCSKILKSVKNERKNRKES